MSRLLRKSSGSCDDEFYARNLWPCRDSQCDCVLGPMDGEDEPKTIAEMYAEDERCCCICGTFRRKVDLFDIVAAGSLR